MADDFLYFGGAPGADLAIDALDEVETAGPKFPAPTLVANAVIPEVSARERRVTIRGVANEATCGVGI